MRAEKVAECQLAKMLVDRAAAFDLVRGKWAALTDGEREDWLMVAREVLRWAS